MTKTLLALAITLGLVGGTSAQTSNPPKMGVDLIFDPKHKCQGISPEIRLSNVPPGVASYEVKLTDLDVPTFHHWSQTLPAEGPVIHEGAGSGYFGLARRLARTVTRSPSWRATAGTGRSLPERKSSSRANSQSAITSRNLAAQPKAGRADKVAVDRRLDARGAAGRRRERRLRRALGL